MIATPKSWFAAPPRPVLRQFYIYVLSVFLAHFSFAGDDSAFAAHAESVFEAAKARLATNSNNAEAQWQFAKACFDWSDYATTDSKRDEIADQGIAAAQKLVDATPTSAAGHYFLAMNLGQSARSKTVGALNIIPQMEAHFKTALGYDPLLDYAGPDRNLGLLYLQAPGWPLSIGNNAKARTHLLNAARLVPEYPGNLLYLIEAQLGWGEKAAAKKSLNLLNEMWPEAKKKYPAADFAADWADWEKRRENARKKSGETSQEVESPHTSPDK